VSPGAKDGMVLPKRAISSSSNILIISAILFTPYGFLLIMKMLVPAQLFFKT
jgi:hypothetical protein